MSSPQQPTGTPEPKGAVAPPEPSSAPMDPVVPPTATPEPAAPEPATYGLPATNTTAPFPPVKVQPAAPVDPYAVTGAPPVSYGAYGVGQLSAQRYQGYAPTNLASPWIRLAAALLNTVLAIVTLGIGYLIWSLVLWSRGTNPGKNILGLITVHGDTGAPVNWNHMAIRNFLCPLTLTIVPFAGIVDVLMIFSSRHQRIIDRWAHTLIVTR